MDDDELAHLTVLMDAADQAAAHATPLRWRRAFAAALMQKRQVKEARGSTFAPDPRILEILSALVSAVEGHVDGGEASAVYLANARGLLDALERP